MWLATCVVWGKLNAWNNSRENFPIYIMVYVYVCEYDINEVLVHDLHIIFLLYSCSVYTIESCDYEYGQHFIWSNNNGF